MTHTTMADMQSAIAAAASTKLTECKQSKCPKRFLIIYGDPGLDNHNLGRLPFLAARTHASEISRNRFPGAPYYDHSIDDIRLVHSTDARAFIEEVNNSAQVIGYLAYFGHSWSGDNWGLLYVGEENAPATNLGDVGFARPNDVPVTLMRRDKFYDNAQIRLFGCRCGYGNNSVAAQMKTHLGVASYGYSNSGGSLFTNDISLGHGRRRTTRRDIHARISARRPVWLIPANGRPTFKRF